MKLKDLIESNNTGLDAIKRAPIVDYDTGVRCIRIGDISNNRPFCDWGYTKVEANNYNKFQLKKGDIIVARTGATIGVNKYIDKDYKSVYNNGLIRIRVKEENNPKYIYYLLQSNNYKNFIKTISMGTSTQPNMQMNDLLNLDVPNFDRTKQDKIVELLGRIDQKIELNNEINNNLHDLCNNLYFKLVSQLDDTNSSVESIKNVAKCVLGGTPSRTKKEYWNGSINWINSGEINKFRIIKASEKITELGLNKSSTTLLPSGTTVLAITGATLGQVSRLEIDSCANQSVIGIITNKKELNNYMYLSILNSINDLVLKQTGGAQQHINKNDVETHEIIVPSTELISQFDEIIRPLFDQISVNCFEINKLEQLRDTLLPKLMNGEIALDNIEI